MKRRTYCQAMKNFKGCITATGLLLLWLCPAILLSQNISVTCPEFEIICTQDDFNCVAEIEIPPLQGSTDCIISSNLSFSYNSASLGSGVVPPEGLIINNAPIGDHQITFEVSDECGNTESCTVSVTVADCGAPLPICINGLAAELMPLNNEVDPDGDGDVDGDGNPDYGALELWALDFIASPNIDCSGPVTYSIHREGEEPDRSIQSIIVTCSDPSPLLLRIYAWDNAFNPYSVQPDGTVGGPNYDFCETYVLIQDNLFSLCEPSDPVTVTGQILTKDGQPVQGVNILGAFEFPLTTTDEEGRYTITAAPNVLTTIQPQYNDDYINGVDINDLYSAHPMVLNFQDFPPYSRIAADLNMSGNVGTFDLVLLNKLILGISTDFPAPSWRFIDADYVFPDPNNPWLEAFPEVININNPSTDTVIANFIGIKIGDVDCSANPNLPEFNQQ